MVHHAHKHLFSKTKKEPIDYVLRFFMIATPLFELPQVYAIYHSHDASGVSLTTWIFFCLSDVAWLTYAYKQKIFPMLVMYSLYLLIESSVVIGVFMYS